jgi:cyclopropane fatty-acyl-phospholipid synthase-like methyltransferase
MPDLSNGFLVDKEKDCWTVSQEFRNHIKQFFQPNKYSFLEVGCYKGLTASFLAEHFVQYLGVDISDNYLIEARRMNSLKHVEFKKFDIYNSNWKDLFFSPDIILIDAIHKYEHVRKDIDNCLSIFSNAYIIFDDYGAWESVFRAVNEAIEQDRICIVQEIGISKGCQLWPDKLNPHSYTHFGSEGVIAKALV